MFGFGKLNLFIQQFNAQIFGLLLFFGGCLFGEEITRAWTAILIELAEKQSLLSLIGLMVN